MLAIQLTSWAMHKMPRRLWHAVHLSSFALFATSTLHGFTAGADNTNLAVQWGALTGGLLVVFLVVFRLLATRRRPASPRTVTPAPVA
jgi:hypothetical protein